MSYCRTEDSAEESNCDYEGMESRKYHFDRSDKNRTPEFVGEIQVMIQNDPS